MHGVLLKFSAFAGRRLNFSDRGRQQGARVHAAAQRPAVYGTRVNVNALPVTSSRHSWRSFNGRPVSSTNQGRPATECLHSGIYRS